MSNVRKKSPLEQILLLRPADDQPSTINASIDALTEKRAAFAAEAEALRAKLANDMLYAPIAELTAADERLLELQRVDVQAGGLIENFTARLGMRRIEVSAESLIKRVAEFQELEAEFERKFFPFYREMVAQFLSFAAEHKAIEAVRARLNGDIGLHNRHVEVQQAKLAGQERAAEGGEGSQAIAPLRKVEAPLSTVYFYKAALSGPDLTPEQRVGGPIAHCGDYWTAETPETPYTFWQEQRLRQQNDKKRQAEHEEPVRNAGPPPNTPYSYTIRQPGTPAPVAADMAEWNTV
jgi:hypothetical protein